MSIKQFMNSNNKTKFVRLFHQDLLWPASDSAALRYYKKPHNFYFPEEISQLLTKTRTVIQAGGHVGLYARQYSGLFSQVYTFEPEDINFSCLTHNLRNCSNVKYFKKCLGSENKQVRLDINSINTGNHSISTSSDLEGNIECVTVDSLDLTQVDLIQLDVEGYELFVLEGAVNTINAEKPAIVIENNRLSKKYHYKFNRIEAFLNQLGYKISKTWDNDVMFQFALAPTG